MVDIHAHLTLFPFNRGEDLWYHCPVGLNEEGDDLPKFTQSDLISAYHGRVNVIVNALYPLEKGFLILNILVEENWLILPLTKYLGSLMRGLIMFKRININILKIYRMSINCY